MSLLGLATVKFGDRENQRSSDRVEFLFLIFGMIGMLDSTSVEMLMVFRDSYRSSDPWVTGRAFVCAILDDGYAWFD